jgi:cytochrome c553
MARRRILTAVVLAVACALAATSALAESSASGEELFQLCSYCHGSDGGGDPLFLAPAIAGMQQWYVEAQLEKFRSGLRGKHPDDVGGMRMRPMSLSLPKDDDVAEVARYVASLPRVGPRPTLTGGDAEAGATVYAPCIACHGIKGEGNPALRAPALVGQNDWYQLSQLRGFKAGIRAGDPRDSTGMLMRPMAMMLSDQNMLDVIAYIQSLSEQH